MKLYRSWWICNKCNMKLKNWLLIKLLLIQTKSWSKFIFFYLMIEYQRFWHSNPESKTLKLSLKFLKLTRRNPNKNSSRHRWAEKRSLKSCTKSQSIWVTFSDKGKRKQKMMRTRMLKTRKGKIHSRSWKSFEARTN